MIKSLRNYSSFVIPGMKISHMTLPKPGRSSSAASLNARKLPRLSKMLLESNVFKKTKGMASGLASCFPLFKQEHPVSQSRR